MAHQHVCSVADCEKVHQTIVELEKVHQTQDSSRSVARWPSESRAPPGCRTLLVLTVIHWAGLAWGLCQAEGLMGSRGQVGVDVGMAMRFPCVCHFQVLMCVFPWRLGA